MSVEGSAVSKKFLQKLVGAGQKAIPVIGQADMGRKILGRFSKEIIGYDFFGLLTKFLFFYLFSALIIKYFEAVLFGSGIVKGAATVLGINLNPPLPDSVTNFFQNGITIKNGDLAHDINPIVLKPWDIVNILAFFLLLAEAISYFENNKRIGGRFSWFTIGVWSVLIGGFGLVTILPILTKFRNAQNVTGPPNIGPAWLPTGYSYSIGSDGKYYGLVSGGWQQAIQDSPTTGHLSGIQLVRVP